MRYLTTKGLFARALGEGRYVLEDVFGVCTMPFFAVDIAEVSKIDIELASSIKKDLARTVRVNKKL